MPSCKYLKLKAESFRVENICPMSYPYQLIVIGSGPGGLYGAIRAAQLGMRVALIEKERVGGVLKSGLHSFQGSFEIRSSF